MVSDRKISACAQEFQRWHRRRYGCAAHVEASKVPTPNVSSCVRVWRSYAQSDQIWNGKELRRERWMNELVILNLDLTEADAVRFKVDREFDGDRSGKTVVIQLYGKCE